MIVAARLALTAALIVMVALGHTWALVTVLILMTLGIEAQAIILSRLSPPRDEARLASLKRLLKTEDE